MVFNSVYGKCQVRRVFTQSCVRLMVMGTLLGGWFGSAAFCATETGRLTVKVMDEAGEPLQIQSVQLWLKKQKTDDNDVGGYRGYIFVAEQTKQAGVFRVTGIPAGKYHKLTVSREGYAPFHRYDIQVTSSAESEIVCRLSKGGRIEGYVTDKEGNPVSGIPVIVNSVECRRDVATDSKGRFIAEHLADVLYSVIAEPKTQSPYGPTILEGGARCGASNIHIVLMKRHGSKTNRESVHKLKPSFGQEDGAFADQVSKASMESGMFAQRELMNKPAPPLVIEKWHNGSFWQLDLKGKVVLLDFWGVWCGPCKQQIPFLKKLHEDYSQRGLVIIGVHTQLRKEEISQFITKETLGYLVAVDYQDKTAEMYRVLNYPTTFLIDRTGLVRSAEPNEEKCEELIKLLLKDELPEE